MAVSWRQASRALLPRTGPFRDPQPFARVAMLRTSVHPQVSALKLPEARLAAPQGDRKPAPPPLERRVSLPPSPILRGKPISTPTRPPPGLNPHEGADAPARSSGSTTPRKRKDAETPGRTAASDGIQSIFVPSQGLLGRSMSGGGMHGKLCVVVGVAPSSCCGVPSPPASPGVNGACHQESAHPSTSAPP